MILLTIADVNSNARIMGVGGVVLIFVILAVVGYYHHRKNKRMRGNKAGELLTKTEDVPFDEFSRGWSEEKWH